MPKCGSESRADSFAWPAPSRSSAAPTVAPVPSLGLRWYGYRSMDALVADHQPISQTSEWQRKEAPLTGDGIANSSFICSPLRVLFDLSLQRFRRPVFYPDCVVSALQTTKPIPVPEHSRRLLAPKPASQKQPDELRKWLSLPGPGCMSAILPFFSAVRACLRYRPTPALGP